MELANSQRRHSLRATKEHKMTTYKAISKAMQLFNRNHKDGDIRKIVLLEGSGFGRDWSDLLIQIEYAIDGDYTESDAKPFVCKVVHNREYDLVNVFEW